MFRNQPVTLTSAPAWRSVTQPNSAAVDIAEDHFLDRGPVVGVDPTDLGVASEVGQGADGAATPPVPHGRWCRWRRR